MKIKAEKQIVYLLHGFNSLLDKDLILTDFTFRKGLKKKWT